jgi:phytoene desaturase
VTVVEKLDTPGGRARVFRDKGYSFDAGPTIITLPHLIDELWELCGKKREDEIEFREMDPFYRIHFHDGTSIACSRDPDKMRAEVARICPEDVPGYERLLEAAEEKFRYGFLKLGQMEFSKFSTMVKVLPGIAIRGGHRTVAEGVQLYLRDPRLQTAFSYHPLLIGGNPHGTTAIYLLILALERRWGVHFAMGGTGAIVRGLAGLIEGQGNTIRYGAEVEEIVVRDGPEGKRATGIKLADGEEIPADIVISNADAGWTWRKLIRQEHRKRWTDAKIENARYSMGLFVWYFGTDRQWPEVEHHSLILGPRYKGLLDDIFRRHKLADDFSLYLHRPTATDPSLAPEGCDAFYALSPVPHLDGTTNWEEHAEAYRQKIERKLEETVLPGLKGSIVTSRVVTPDYFRDELLSLKGAGFSLEPTLFQSAWFRPHNKAEGIDRLFLVGGGTHPGAGVPGVLTSAQIVDEMVPDAASLV